MRINKYSVRSALSSYGVSQSALAKKLGVSRERVSQWCRDCQFLIDAKTGHLVRLDCVDGVDYYVPVGSIRGSARAANQNILKVLEAMQ